MGDIETGKEFAEKPSAEKLEQTEPDEKERVASVPQREQLASTPEPPLPKGKGTKSLV